MNRRLSSGWLGLTVIGWLLASSVQASSFSLESIGESVGSGESHGIAVNVLSGKCTGVTTHYGEFVASDTVPKLAPGWQDYYGAPISQITTPYGKCSFSTGSPASCCHQIGLKYTDTTGIKILSTTTASVSICGNGPIGSSQAYCQNRAAETKTAVIREECQYRGSIQALIINPRDKSCGLEYTPSTYGKLYTVDKKQIGTAYNLEGIIDFTDHPTNCPAFQPVTGDRFEPQNLGNAIVLNKRVCQLSAVGTPADCCAVLGFTYVPTIESSGGSVKSLLVAASVLVIAGLALFFRRRKVQPQTL